MSARLKLSRRRDIPLTRHIDNKPIRLISCNDGEDESVIILPAPKGMEPTRWRIS